MSRKATARPPQYFPEDVIPEVETKRQALKAAQETQYFLLLAEADVQALSDGIVTPFVRHQAGKMLQLAPCTVSEE